MQITSAALVALKDNKNCSEIVVALVKNADLVEQWARAAEAATMPTDPQGMYGVRKVSAEEKISYKRSLETARAMLGREQQLLEKLLKELEPHYFSTSERGHFLHLLRNPDS